MHSHAQNYSTRLCKKTNHGYIYRKIMLMTATRHREKKVRAKSPVVRHVHSELQPAFDLVASRRYPLYEARKRFEVAGVVHSIARFLFVGPPSGGDYMRIGIFAGIHGDEIGGVHTAIEFVKRLCTHPELARGYEIVVTPICNPTGFMRNTRVSHSGKDLNREFWKGSREPEVMILEKELVNFRFDGNIALHSDDTSDGIYGFIGGATLTRHLLEPAMDKASHILKRNKNKMIDRFDADNGIIEHGYSGILAVPPHVRPRPFEIVFETPLLAPLKDQVDASLLVLETILSEYRTLMAEGINL